MKRLRPFLAVLCACSFAVPDDLAQDSRGAVFSGLVRPYQAREVPPVNLANSGRLEQLLRAGKLYLSLQDAIALALENNIDIELERYGIPLAQADLLRAQSGSAIEGVPTIVAPGLLGVAGTGVQTLTTSSLTDQNGLGGPAGTNTNSLDPLVTSKLSWGHLTSPQTSQFVTGTSALITTQRLTNVGISQSFLTGTTASLNLTNSFTTQNAYRNDINPYAQSNLDLNISQNLLQGFGRAVNNRYIRIAKINLSVSDLVFQQQAMATVANVVSLYWNLVSFNQQVDVARRALELSQRLYRDNKQQVEVGTLAPLDIVRAEAEVASREQDLTTAETSVLQQETILKNALSRTGIASPSVSAARIVPTDPIRMPDKDPVEPIQDLMERALAKRPELGQSRLQIDSAKINLAGNRNALLPTLQAYVDLQSSALAGQVNQIPVPPSSGTGPATIRTPAAVNDFFLGNYGTVLQQLFGRNFPTYSAGIQLSIPLRNRANVANYATAELNLRQNELQLQRQVNQVRVDVQNALIALQQARARYGAAVKARVLQEQTTDAEQKKYQLGASTVYNVVLTERDLATAQFNEVAAEANYMQARVQLNLSMGETLEKNNVSIAEARNGKVSTPPSPIPDR